MQGPDSQEIQDIHSHYPFEHVEIPSLSLSSHRHHVRREDDTETRDFATPRIPDRLASIFSKWGWLTPESEGRSASQATSSDHGPSDQGTQSHPPVTDLQDPKSKPMRRASTTKFQSDGTLQTSFEERYGRFNKVLHYDDSNTVQLYEKKVQTVDQTTTPPPSSGQMLARLRRGSISNTVRELYAVKVFRNTPKPLLSLPGSFQSETPSIALSHPNIVPILDILYNKQNNLCFVMPYFAGGNLHTFMAPKVQRAEKLSTDEANCLAIQMLRAVAFLHGHNIAHGDIRPEHVLLTAQGAVKLSGFGEDQDAIRELIQISHGRDFTSSRSVSSARRASASNHTPPLCIRSRVSNSSIPYLPPERFPSRRGSRRQSYTHQDVNDVRKGDIWACGIIYMFLRSGKFLWQSAQSVTPDEAYVNYLNCRLEDDGYSPIQALGNRCRNVVYAMLHPVAGSRITAAEILRSEWALGVAVCEVGEKGL